MSHVQSASASNDAAAASIAATFGSTVGTSNLVAGFVTWSSALIDLVSITDDKSNTYTIVDEVLDTGINQGFASFFKEGITNAPITITANFTNTPGGRTIVIGEKSGLATSSALDNHAMQRQVNPGTGTDAITSGSAVTASNGDTILSGVINCTSGSLATTVVGTGFTIRETIATATLHMKSEDMTQTIAGSVAGTWTDATNGGAGNYLTGMMAFKAAATSGGMLAMMGVG